jgi:hypothetical protein
MFLLAFLALGSCAQSPRFTPLTANLYEQLKLDNTNIQNIQMYYRAKKRELDMPRTRDTRFHYRESAETRTVAAGRKAVITTETVTTREDIVLYNGTPCVIVNAQKTRRNSYRLKADFGDDIILEFENNRPDGIFYLVTDRIHLEDRDYVLEKGYYGFLALQADQRSRTRTDRTIYEIRGKVLD